MARQDEDDAGKFSAGDGNDLPQKRKRRDDDDDADRPRNRRGADEDDEYDDDRIRRKHTQIASGGFDQATLRTIALSQKGICFCILANILIAVGFFFLPQEIRIVGAIANLCVGLVSAIFVFVLAIKVYLPVLGVFFALFTIVPCVGLLCLLVINARATSALQSNGIRVGLLGANMDDLR